jgi:hypothetical protein
VVVPETPIAKLAPIEEPETLPTFGQDLGEGKVAMFLPEKPPAPVASKVATPAASVSRADVIAGSTAEKLFVKGEATPAPAGRFDDFSYAPSP